MEAKRSCVDAEWTLAGRRGKNLPATLLVAIDGGGLGLVALLVFKTSVAANPR